MSLSKTHFGFKEVNREEKPNLVNQVFSSVANRYDVMNDLMSAGLHRLWKRFAVNLAQLKAGEHIMDLAGGTGHLTRLIYEKFPGLCPIWLVDFNLDMLSKGRTDLIDRNIIKNIEFIQGNAEILPFKDQSFDCIFISFGLRNVTHIDRALRSMYEKLKPGGRVIILEFSKPHLGPLNQLYDLYSFEILPRIGDWVVGDKESYQYLAESIRMHPDQETLKKLMQEQGFEQCDYFNLSGGIVAAHRGFKF